MKPNKNGKLIALILAIVMVFGAGIGIANITGSGGASGTIPLQDADSNSGGTDWSNEDAIQEALWGNKKGQTGNQDNTGTGTGTKPAATAPAVSRTQLQRYGTIETLVKSVDDPTKPDPKAVAKTSYGTVDWSNAAQGYVTFTAAKDYEFYLDGPNRTCGIFYVSKDETVKIGLTDGTGKYEYGIGTIVETATGSGMKVLYKNSFEVKAIDSDLAPYLVSTPFGDFENAPKTQAKADELWSDQKSQLINVKDFSGWVYKNIKYDKAFKTGPNDLYVNPDTVLANGAGVCNEFSKLLTAMLRSQGIPAYYESGKFANIPNGSHAWTVAWVELSSEHKNGKTYSTGAWVLLDGTGGSIHNHATLGNGKYETSTTKYKN